MNELQYFLLGSAFLLFSISSGAIESDEEAECREVVITVEERSGTAVADRVVRRGVPFAAGMLHSLDGLRLRDDDGLGYPLQAEVLQRHHDGSIQWVSVAFLPDLAPRETREFYLIDSPESEEPQPAFLPRAEERDGVWMLENEWIRVEFSPRGIAGIHRGETSLLTEAGAGLEVATSGGSVHTWVADETEVIAQGPVFTTVRRTGTFEDLGMRAEWLVTLAAGAPLIEHEMRLIATSDATLQTGGIALNLRPEFSPETPPVRGVVGESILELVDETEDQKLLLHAPDIDRFRGTAERLDDGGASANGFAVVAGTDAFRVLFAPIQIRAEWTWYDGVSRTVRLSMVPGEPQGAGELRATVPPAAWVDPRQFVASGALATRDRPPSVERAVAWTMGALNHRDGHFEAGAIPQRIVFGDDGTVSVGGSQSRPGETAYNLWFVQMQDGDPDLYRMLVEDTESWADVVVYRGRDAFLTGAARYGSINQYGTSRFFTSHPYYGDASGLYLTYLMTGNPYFRETFERVVNHSVGASNQYPTFGGFRAPRRFNWGGGNVQPLSFIESRNLMQARGLAYAERMFDDERYGEIAGQLAGWARHVQHERGFWYQAYFDHGGPLTQSGLDLPSAKNYIMLYGVRSLVAFRDHLAEKQAVDGGLPSPVDRESRHTVEATLLEFADYLLDEQQEDGWLWDPISDGEDFAANVNEDMRRGQMPRQEIMAIEVLDGAYRISGDERYFAGMLEMLRYYLATQQTQGGWSSRNQHRNHEDGTVQGPFLGNNTAQFLRIAPRLQVTLSEKRDTVRALGFRDLPAVLSSEALDARADFDHGFLDEEVGFNAFDTSDGRVIYVANFSGWRSGDWTKPVDLHVDEAFAVFEGALNAIDSGGTRIRGVLEQFARLYAHELPVTLVPEEIDGEIEVRVLENGPQRLALELAGSGSLRAVIADGEFPVRDESLYRVELNGETIHSGSPEDGKLVFAVNLPERGEMKDLEVTYDPPTGVGGG